MKKNLLSLLLVVAIMMTSVSMGFGSLVATAGAAGGGVETIHPFSLTQKSDAIGTSFGTKITIKSTDSNYQIKVNSVSATIRYYQDETSALTTVIIDSSVNGAVIGADGKEFDVTGSIGADLAGIIRYEVNYDLLDNSGKVKYAGMTGYGYGAVSANGKQTGGVGTQYGAPSSIDSDWKIDSFGNLNTAYVQTPTLTLSYTISTDMSWFSGTSSETKTQKVTAGIAPPSMTFPKEIKFPYKDGWANGRSETGEWLKWSETNSAFYEFTVYLGWDGTNTTIPVKYYNRNETDKSAALEYFKQYLEYGLEKSYYTTDSWNKYLTELENLALVGMAIPGPNDAFKLACQKAASVSTGTAIANAKNNLELLPADYKALEDAVNAFAAIMNNMVNVSTYTNGAEVLGSEDLRLYTQASVDSAIAWYNANATARNHYKYQQEIVDGYTAEVIRLTENLTYSDAVYTYLNLAISEYEGMKKSDYTNTTWAAYEGAVNNAKALSKSLKANSQDEINTHLSSIVSAQNNLKFVQADTVYLQEQINNAILVEGEKNNNKLFVNAEGFNDAWSKFETAYAQAKAVENYTIDKQAAVDSAATELAKAIAGLSDYRLLDTTELQAVLELTPEYEQSKYVADSYSTWNRLKLEGYDFLDKADSTYTGSDRKTQTHLNEMNRLIASIRSAFEGLEKVKADFTELNAVVAQIPSDEVLALYKQEKVDAIKDIVKTIDYGATFDKQEDIKKITSDLTAALAELTPENYRDADYSGVEDAIADAGKLNRDEYVNFEIVDEAIGNVVYGKKIIDQDKVDAMEKAIRDAIKNLKFDLADYSDVKAAIAEANAIKNKEWYANYYIIESIIAGIDWNITLENQDQVDAYAKAIRDAIVDLKLAEADYSGVTAAINESKELGSLTDFNDDFVARLDLAISKVVAGYTKDKQAEVDAMEAEIRAVLATAEENLRPADYTRLNSAIAFAENRNPEDYSNYDVVADAINSVNRDLNCRQTEEMQAEIDKIYAAVEKLKLRSADYSAVEKARDDARYAYNNGPFEYTEESIAKVEEAIAAVDWDLDIKSQTKVNLYAEAINKAVSELKYVRADYTELDKVIADYEALERDLYASLGDIDAYVAGIDMDITIDKQHIVDVYANELSTMLDSLEYGPADYSAIRDAEVEYASLNKDHYPEEYITAMDEALAAVERGYTKDQQAEVDKMAANVVSALNELKANMLDADLTSLRDAETKAKAKLDEMNSTDYEIDFDTYEPLRDALNAAKNYKEGTTKIKDQSSVDELTARILEATENLEYVFALDLEGTGIIIDEEGFIYGFEEGTMSEDARELIKFVGAAELKIIETKNGFGTGTRIQFIDKKTGEAIDGYTFTVVVFGDANGDAVIDTFDVAYIAEIANMSKNEDPDKLTLKSIDLSPDGYIDALDVGVMISLANMDSTLMQDGSMRTY